VVSNIQELAGLPIRTGSGTTVHLRDIGYVEDSTDIVTSYALANGRRAVYIPVTKRADASTLAVVNRVKAALPQFKELVPDDIAVSFEMDQSVYVTNALKSLTTEGLLGALLAGLMVLLFLRSWRSALIVVLTIPFSLLAAVVGLWAVGQTLNIMTLGGLALAIGILVDESTVAIENIHTHMAQGKSGAYAILDAGAEVAFPMLVAVLCVLAVFIPSFFMVGVGRALFVPLALAVGFAMATSYLMALTFVPVMAAWILHHDSKSDGAEGPTAFARMRAKYARMLRHVVHFRWAVVVGYVVLAGGIIGILSGRLGMEIFPAVDTGQFQLRLRAPDGTRIERTEVIAQKVLDAIKQDVGPGKVAITLGFVGTQPSFAPVNTIHLWTNGPHEAVLFVALKPGSGISVEQLQERLRQRLPVLLPGTRLSFEAGDIVSKVMSMGAPTPIEIAVSGPQLQANRTYAEKLISELAKVPVLRDLQFGQPLDYPTVDISIDRERAGQLGITATDIGRSLVSATSSSRFVRPIYWRDPSSGLAYQVQVEVPQSQMTSIEDIQNIPVMRAGVSGTLVRDVATVSYGTMMGEYARYNMQRMITITANVVGEDLGRAANRVSAAMARVGSPPKGVTATVRGQVTPMRETLDGLQVGIGLAIVVVMLLLAANFQSFRDAFIVISTAPAVIAGVVAALWLSGTTLNVQSFMGAIMAIGVAVANAILLVTFAERRHREGASAAAAAIDGAQSRIRPILMTSLAMIAGMIPLALGLGEGSEQTAPLGRAVIGGLVAATLATLMVVPAVYAIVHGRGQRRSPSLIPDGPQSALSTAPAGHTPKDSAL
jgi:multidrug efflux pump subunit AcrB